MKLEYIVSGTSFCRLSLKDNENYTDLGKNIKNIFKKFNDYYPDNNISLLFNAFTEKGFGETLGAYDVPLYADSGGLQIITLKTKELTESLKTEIYDVQSKIDYAMCFDEIPLFIEESAKGNSARTTMTGKCVIGEVVYDKGVETGLNIKNQVDHFIKTKSDAKVFVILQGNSKQDWLDFSNGVFDQLSERHYPHIEGLAVADTCIGNGILEATDMYSVIPLINCPDNLKKRIHLLGVGSISRLIPIVVMSKSGYLSADTHISYDSTSISSSFVFGRYLGPDSTIQYDKVIDYEHSHEIELVVDDMLNKAKEFDWLPDMMFNTRADYVEMFKNHSSNSIGTLTTDVHAKDSIDGIKSIKHDYYQQLILFHTVYLLSQLANFTNKVVEVVKDENLKAYLKTHKKTKPLISLLKVKTYEEYEAWRVEATATMNVHSNRIRRVDTHEEFNKKPDAFDIW